MSRTHAITAVLVFLLVGLSVIAETPASETNPLAPFERLFGSRWSAGDTITEIEWGVARKTVNAKTYFVVDGNESLSAEGRWFWNPAEGAIKGFVVADGMPFEILDMTTHFEGDMLLSDLQAIDAKGVVSAYQETWQFEGDDKYLWTLYTVTEDGREPMMKGTYERVE